MAGLALFCDSNLGQQCVAKGASWQSFDNIKLRNSEFLSLGHCTGLTSFGSHRDIGNKVTIIAGSDSPLWGVQCMWGM